MRPEDREDLLWQLTEIEDRAAHPDIAHSDAEHPNEAEQHTPLSDEQLRAFRAGELAPEQGQEVERLLRASAANRRRLRELAAPGADTAPADIRRKILDAHDSLFEAQDSSAGPSVDSAARHRHARPSRAGRNQSGPRQRWKRRSWGALLAAAAALIAVVIAWPLLAPKAPPPEYSVQLSALESHRGDPSPSQPKPLRSAEAYAETPVVIEATVIDRAIAGVEAGLYRQIDNSLQRLDTADSTAAASTAAVSIKRENLQGVVRLTAPAAVLTGELGRNIIFMVIAWQGDLPLAVPCEPGEDARSKLEADGRRGVHQLVLNLLPSP